MTAHIPARTFHHRALLGAHVQPRPAPARIDWLNVAVWLLLAPAVTLAGWAVLLTVGKALALAAYAAVNGAPL